MADWSGSSVLFEDTIQVSEVDGDGKIFQLVSRIKGISQIQQDVQIILDIHSELYPVQQGDHLSIKLCSSLSTDGAVDKGEFTLHEDKPQLSQCEYCMYGLVYRHQQEQKGRLTVLISFGGLLMSLTGTFAELQQLEIDTPVYLMLYKT